MRDARIEAELLATIDTLRRAFEAYGQHEIDCPRHPRFEGFYIGYRCDCGFLQTSKDVSRGAD